MSINSVAEASSTSLTEFGSEVLDATLVLDYVVANGVLGAGGGKIGDDLIAKIKVAQDLVKQEDPLLGEQRANFEAAYRDLAIFVSPVTAETLRATSEAHSVSSFQFTLWGPRPISIIWSRKLSLWALLFIFVALLSAIIDAINGPLTDAVSRTDPLTRAEEAQIVLQKLVPFTYGAIGACVSLLKACQAYIHMRQFDARRVPEYYNRMILGAVSGGMIVLLITQPEDGDATLKLSAAALGFIAGYNSDLLFSAIERISSAVLPKFGKDGGDGGSGPRKSGKGEPAQVHDVSLKDLLDRHKEAATDED